MAISSVQHDGSATVPPAVHEPSADETLSMGKLNGRTVSSAPKGVVAKIKAILAQFFYSLYSLFSEKNNDQKKISPAELETKYDALLLNLGEAKTRLHKSEEENKTLMSKAAAYDNAVIQKEFAEKTAQDVIKGQSITYATLTKVQKELEAAKKDVATTVRRDAESIADKKARTAFLAVITTLYGQATTTTTK